MLAKAKRDGQCQQPKPNGFSSRAAMALLQFEQLFSDLKGFEKIEQRAFFYFRIPEN